VIVEGFLAKRNAVNALNRRRLMLDPLRRCCRKTFAD
jgi:hypothetical protein